MFISVACKQMYFFLFMLLLLDEYQSMQFPTATKKSIWRIRWKLDKWKSSLSNVKTLDGLPLKIEKKLKQMASEGNVMQFLAKTEVGY